MTPLLSKNKMRYKRISFLAFIMVLISVVQNHAQSARVESIRLLEEGDNLLRLGVCCEEAIMAYSNAITADPTFAEAYMKRAKLYDKIGRYRESKSDYDQAVKINPYTNYIYDEPAKLNMLAMDYKGGLEDLNLALSLDKGENILNTNPTDFILNSYYTDLLLDTTSYIYLLNDPEGVYVKKSLAYYINKNEPNFKVYLDSALSLKNTSALTYDLKGIFHMQNQEYQQALDAFNESIIKDPNIEISYFNRAVVYRHLNNSLKAMSDLNQSIRLSPQNSKLYFTRALLKKEHGDYEGAIEDYNQALQHDSLYLNALYNKVMTLKLMGSYAEALAGAEKIIEWEREDAENWNLMGNIYVLQEDYNLAIEAFNNAISYKIDYAEAYHNRGLAYIMSYRKQRGCSDLEESLRLGHQKSLKFIQGFCGN